MCSTPKRTGVMFRSARVEEDRAGSVNYVTMLRRASERMDRLQQEREAQQEQEAATLPSE